MAGVKFDCLLIKRLGLVHYNPIKWEGRDGVRIHSAEKSGRRHHIEVRIQALADGSGFTQLSGQDTVRRDPDTG